MIDRKKLLLFIFLFISFYIYPYTPPIRIDKIGIEKGLSNNRILCIAQDKDGFVWIGTEWGLNRFDGHSFKNFKTHSPDNNTVSDNAINEILVDKDDNALWIATKYGGLNMFDCVTHKFVHYPTHSKSPNSTHSNGITDMCFSKEGDVWLATYNNGLKKLDKKNNKIIHFDTLNIPQLKGYKIKSIADDMNGNLYIGHWGEGFSIYSTKDNSIKHYLHDPNNMNGLPGNEVLDICIDSKHRIWLATHRGIALYNVETEKFTVFRHNKENPHSLTKNDIHSICEINNSLWLGTWRGGVNILDLNTSLTIPEKVHFEHIPFNDFPSGLSSSSIIEIFHDSFGNTWLGTDNDGLNIIGHLDPFFQTLSYSPIKGDENGLSDKVVTCVEYDRNNLLWVGTGNGQIDIYERSRINQSFKKRNNISFDNDILALLTDSNGNKWFGIDKEGLVRLDKKKNILEKINLNYNNYLNTYVSCICEDRESNIWIGTNDAIFKYNLKNEHITEYNGKKIGLSNNLIRSICQDNNGNYWIGSGIDGVSIVTPEFKLIRNLNNSNGLNSNIVNHIYKDSKGRIWVATTQGVVVFPSLAAQRYDFYILDNKNGVSDNYIRAITEGKPDEMWLTTNAGVSKYSLDNKKIENYDYHDGIPWGTFRNGAVTKSLDGTIFFGSQDGICYFNSNNNLENHKLPPVTISSFNIYSRDSTQFDRVVNFAITPKINLKNNQNTFTIEFNVMDFALNNQIEYAYYLKGIDDIWHQIKGQNHVTFRNLSHGEYTFFVKAKIKNQEWAAHIAKLDIKIAPPLWLSWWAKVIYVCFSIFLIFMIIRFYKRRFNLEKQLYLEKQNYLHEQELHEERLRFYTNIAHELRTPLTLIIGPLQDLTMDEKLEPKQRKKISLIHKSTIRLSNLINQIMEFRKSETHNRVLTITYGNISTLIQEITLKYKELNQNKNVLVNLHLNTISQIFYDKEIITIILDNIISNALKYTVDGSVSVFLREIIADDLRYVEIEIKDTGYGIPKENLERIFDRYYQVKGEFQASGTGIGLALVKNLVKLHEGIITVKSKVNECTSFFFRLRIDNTYPAAIHIENEKNITERKTNYSQVMLIIEDNDDIRDYISDSFSDVFEIFSAKNGQEGLQLAMEKIPDIIISDIMMPIMDGVAMSKALREDVKTSHIPIILLTAKDTVEDKTEGYSVGADSYITKPFSANLLKSRVNNILQNRKKIADYFLTNNYKKAISSNSLNQLDNEFVEKTISIIEDNMESEQISVTFLSQQLHMSYSTFSRKIKATTGMTVNELVRKIKMQHAEQLLLTRKYTISEIIFMIGYSSMAYFREAFKAEFGAVPSEYIKNLEKED